MTKSYRLAQVALVLAVLLPVWFMVAALGTKIGLWGWQTGLGTMSAQIGPIMMGAVGLLALIALIWCLVKPPRKGWLLALVALLIPAIMMVTAGGMRDRAGENPIHDVSTDAVDPPTFSQALVDMRAENELNPIRDYSAVLRDSGPWGDNAFPDVADETHTSLVPQLYPDLEPLVVDASAEDALVAAQAAMMESGYDNVFSTPDEGRVEGVSETFWYGFKDDVVARIRTAENGTVIDFRSVSRVGLSDLGANADRIRELRAAVAEKLGA
ncbi:DUF1499 domain-containing protein [Altererythrobacter sp. MF3-039]|uniref:DUF1499 domain-containing protein n=1 Tax=Altererythrobacter sp. MF3-039 TaxID=3252901 RepID=UPI00390C9247